MNIIYYFSDKNLTTWNDIIGCKIGSTCNIIARIKTYRTGFVYLPNIVYYITPKIHTNLHGKIALLI